MPSLDLLLGRPLSSAEARGERIGTAAGIPIFGLDALSSAAYGPEAALVLLIPLGSLGVRYSLPINAAISLLLLIVYFSYRQTIEAYPSGGGSYTVARENLGETAGLLAASALMIDYVLTVAVGISAGVGALISAVPALQPRTLSLCLLILLIVLMVNLRGVRETGTVFMVPTYLFLACLLIVIAIGVVKTIFSGGHPTPVLPAPRLSGATATVSWWLLLQAFASGCTAMTGVEAVSNGVKAFKETRDAQRTLTVIIALLITLLLGIAYLVRVYGVMATDPGRPGYESVLSILTSAVTGKGAFYYVAMASILAVLALSANTAFADFPRLCRIIATDGFLPKAFAVTGRRLVFSHGIYVLGFLAGILLIVFGGVTDRLIPLYAVGAFLAFTFSQAGMVMHWQRKGGAGAFRYMLVNGVGAVATGITVVVVLVAKFVQGAWMTMLLIPGLFVLMLAVSRYYERVKSQVRCSTPVELHGLRPPKVVIPVQGWNQISKEGLRFAFTISPDVHAVHVASSEDEAAITPQEWQEYAAEPASLAGLPAPELVTIPSPYRFVILPIVQYVLQLEHSNPDRLIAVLIPEMVERKWYEYLLHNQRGELLRLLLFAKGNRRVVTVTVPWYLDS